MKNREVLSMEKHTDTQSYSSINLNGRFHFMLDDDQSLRFINAVFAGELLPWDITESFIRQMDKACAAEMEMNQKESGQI